VSVVVPVYNPGADIDDCIRSLLGQTLRAGALELIFVDDGSTDATPARLDELARRHAHVRVEHIPNSGWPGRPRNVGLGMARGDYVFFVDNDDWLEADALAHLHATAVQDRADVVVGKVVGDGKKTVPRGVFEHNMHGVPFESARLLGLLTPHKLFRRAFVEQHGLRFPEGKRRLEDHPFVLEAYFRAERISVVADRPVYHWVRREKAKTASSGVYDAQQYFANLREVLDLVEANTEPGPWRDALLAHYYRGKMLRRAGGRDWLWRDAEWRRELYEEVRALALERFDEDVHERLPFNLRLRSKVLRAGGFDTLGRLARYERRLQPVTRIREIVHGGTHLVLRLESWLGTQDARLRFERRGDRMFWVPPTENLATAIADADREVTGELRRSRVEVFLRNVADESEYTLPARTSVRLKDGKEPGWIRPRLATTVPIAPTAAAAGGPLPPGTWEVHAAVIVAGFTRTEPILRRGEPLVVTTYAPGRIVAAGEPPPPPPLPHRVYRRMPGPVAKSVRRTRARAAAVARR
jgi:glycosyltransferase involved in cell wall biosynthesis